jgi:hypothetical protein
MGHFAESMEEEKTEGKDQMPKRQSIIHRISRVAECFL